MNYLNKYIFPKLREFTTSRYGFEFQVVDLFWGINDETINKESFVETCFKELEKCQQDSIGINFLSLIGDLYGYNDVPEWIERQNFEIIIQCLKEAYLDFDSLTYFYHLNINYLSNRYELVYKNHMNIETKQSLAQLLTIGTKLAVEKNLLDSTFLNNIDSSSKFPY